jgi:O-antigen ligase
MLIYIIYLLRVFSDSFENSYYSSIIGGLIILCAIYIFFKKKYKATFNNYYKPFVKFVVAYFLVNFLWILVSILRFGNILLLENIYQILRFAAIIGIIYLLSYYCARKNLNLKKLIELLTYIYLFISIISIISVLNGSVKRAQWPHSHPNTLGTCFVIFLIYRIPSIKKFNSFEIFKIFLLFAGLLSTKSLSSFLILLVALFIYFIKAKRKFIFISSLLIILLLINLFGLDTFIIERINNISLNRDVIEYAGMGYINNSFEWRIYNWTLLIEEFLKKPLLGYGTLGWMIINPLRSTLGFGFLPHNEFVGWLVQFGVIGSLVLLCFLINMLIKYYRKIRLYNYQSIFPFIIIPFILAAIAGRTFVDPLNFYYFSLILFSERKIDNLNSPQVYSKNL